MRTERKKERIKDQTGRKEKKGSKGKVKLDEK